MTGMRTIAFANALALVGTGAYLVCFVLAAVAPNLFAAIFESWFHGALPGPEAGAGVAAGGILLGLFTVGVAAWIFGLAFAAVYNRLSGKRSS